VNGTSSRALAKRPYTGCEKTQVKNAPGALVHRQHPYLTVSKVVIGIGIDLLKNTL